MVGMVIDKVDLQDTSGKEPAAYIVGGGVASLACAVYLISEAGFPGKNIHILEHSDKLGGALDGAGDPQQGYVIRGGRMHEEHFACTWDLLARIPTLEDPRKSVTDEIFSFNEKVVSGSKSRLLKAGQKMDLTSYGLSKRDSYDMLRLIFHPEASIGRKTIADWFDESFFETVFWLLWSTTFAFQKWSSVVEMRRYFLRFIHLLPGFYKLGGIMRTVYNQYDSVITPLEAWLRGQDVQFHLEAAVVDVEFNITATQKTASALHYLEVGERKTIRLSVDDYLFVTLGSMVEDSTLGSMKAPPEKQEPSQTGAWALWKNIARHDAAFGNPGIFCDHPDLSKWMSFTVTLKDPAFFEHMELFTGNPAGTGGLVTITDSNWFMSVVLAYQPHFRNQPDDVYVFWGDGLLPDREGNFVKKKMSQCSGVEILHELFSHLGITDSMQTTMETANCIPCMMPYIDSQFLPRGIGDRPDVIPPGATNFAFMGQFVEVPDDCVFTVEYSVRTAQAAVYTLLLPDKKITPVYAGHHDIHILIEAMKAINR